MRSGLGGGRERGWVGRIRGEGSMVEKERRRRKEGSGRGCLGPTLCRLAMMT